MRVLVFNAGSSSLKFGVFEGSEQKGWARVAGGQMDWAEGDRGRAKLTGSVRGEVVPMELVDVRTDARGARCALGWLGRMLGEGFVEGIAAVGHRVVHGGAAYGDAVVVDEGVMKVIEEHREIAPLHNPPALEVLRYCRGAMPAARQVAVFDTAYFAGLGERDIVYPLPWEWYEKWGVRRFGFHGISHRYCVGRTEEMMGRRELRIVSCHLGGGCSVAAIEGGRPVASTMGYTPLEGLMMGTRSGSVDPGILLHVMRRHGLSVAEVDGALNGGSGLAGVSGVSADMAKVEAAAAAGDGRARLAVEMFCDRVRAGIAGMAVRMGGVDVVVFTDRVGEGSAGVRAEVCRGLECLGVRIDGGKNAGVVLGDVDVAEAGSGARVLVIHTEEEVGMVREVGRVVELSD